VTALAEAPFPSDLCVKVWFGEHVIAEYASDPVTALRYQAAMTRRFASLRVTIEPATAVVDEDAANS
jgi:hypothetical protein